MNNFRVFNTDKEASRIFLLLGLWGSDLGRRIVELIKKHSKHMSFKFGI